jgi:hypothetical protein
MLLTKRLCCKTRGTIVQGREIGIIEFIFRKVPPVLTLNLKMAAEMQEQGANIGIWVSENNTYYIKQL